MTEDIEKTSTDVPLATDSWELISLFALSFDPGEDNPMKIKSENLALLSSDNSLKGIRAHLFIEQRRWNHYGRMPDEKAIQQIRNLITLIRKKLSIPTG